MRSDTPAAPSPQATESDLHAYVRARREGRPYNASLLDPEARASIDSVQRLGADIRARMDAFGQVSREVFAAARRMVAPRREARGLQHRPVRSREGRRTRRIRTLRRSRVTRAGPNGDDPSEPEPTRIARVRRVVLVHGAGALVGEALFVIWWGWTR